MSLPTACAGAAESVSILLEIENNRLDDIVVEDPPPSTLKNLDFFGLLPVGVFPLLFSVSLAYLVQTFYHKRTWP